MTLLPARIKALTLALLAAAILQNVPRHAASAPLPPYCGAPPADVTTPAPPDMQLRFLIVTVRHGDRTPVGLYPGQTAGPGSNSADDVEWHCDLKELVDIDTGNETWVQSGRLLRKRYLNNREVLPGNCLFGQLTTKGRQQHVTLGKSLRALYVEKYQFLGPELNASEVWSRSTDVPRTIASAQSLLAGMYPSTAQERIPIFDLHTIDQSQDNMTPNTRLCPYLNQIYQDLMHTPPWIEHLQEMAPLIAKLRFIFNISTNATVDIVGVEADSLLVSDFIAALTSSPPDVFDQTYSRICHEKRRPPGISGLEQLISTNAQFEMAYFYNQTQTSISLNIGSFVAEQVSRLDEVVSGRASSLKFVLYSGHDTTLWPLSFAYGFGSISYWPPYASHMEIELWQRVTMPYDYSVRFSFNGRQVPALGCSTPGLCPWATFRQAIASVLPSDFARECTKATITLDSGRDLSRFFRLR